MLGFDGHPFVIHDPDACCRGRIDLNKRVGDRFSEEWECPVLTVRTRLFYARRELARMAAGEPELAGRARPRMATSAVA